MVGPTETFSYFWKMFPIVLFGDFTVMHIRGNLL